MLFTLTFFKGNQKKNLHYEEWSLQNFYSLTRILYEQRVKALQLSIYHLIFLSEIINPNCDVNSYQMSFFNQNKGETYF